MEKLKTNELSLGLDQTFRNDLVDNFEKIQEGVDGQSDAINKQITDFLGGIAPLEKALSFTNVNNFITNGSFATGKTDPAITTNNDTKLSVTNYIGRNWLQITGVGNSNMRGAQWFIDASDKVSAIQHYPLKLSFDIMSTVSQTFNIDIHFYDNNGQDMNNAIGIDQLKLNAWQLLNYQKTVDLNIGALTGVAKVSIMIFSNNTGDLGRVLLTALSVNVKYSDNKLPGANLLPSKPLTVNNNSQITDTSYLGEVWHKLTTVTAGTGQGYQWIIDDADKVSLLINYPLNLSFNLCSLTVDQTFNLDVHFLDKDGKDLGNSVNIDSIHTGAGALIHYEKQVTFSFSSLQNVAKISFFLFSTNVDSVGTIILNHESALLQFKTNQLKGPELIDGNPIPTNPDTVISTTKYLDQKWFEMTSTANTQYRGLQLLIDNPDKILEMANYPVKINFNIQSSIDQKLGLDFHFYDSNGKDINNLVAIDTIELKASKILNYQTEFSLNSDNLKGVTTVAIWLSTSGTSDLGTVLVNDYSAVLEYNTNPNQLPGLPELIDGNPIPTNGDTVISTTKYLDQKWFEMTSTANTQYRGLKLLIDNPDKILEMANYPVKINFSIQSSIDQNLGLDFHFCDNNGKDINNLVAIDTIELKASKILNYGKFYN
ncbi:hypothetical protein [Lactiplantibacillus plantarum]